ncbi:MAG: autotransporter domain-containing protein [Amphiplicatus sp.]|nr:autotransporter domain-containing protein [Amphiplicatus sp.]
MHANRVNRASSKSRLKFSAAGLSIVAAMQSLAQATPAVFFTDDITLGQTRFNNTVASADPTAILFSHTITDLTAANFSVTSGGTTVYVRTSQAGAPADYASYSGFTTWGVSYDTNVGFDAAVDAGYTIEFFADAGYTTPFIVNAVGVETLDWGTCCTGTNSTPTGSAPGTAIYMVFDPSSTASINAVGNITTPIPSTTHFVAAIDDRNSFSSVTLTPNGIGEFFGAGGLLTFSFVPIGSVPAGSSYVTVGGIVIPDIDLGGPYTTQQLNNGDVNPVFDGGILRLAGSGEVSTDFTVNPTGGEIDTNGEDATFSGEITGSGDLMKSGAGTLTLSGLNTLTGGFGVTNGTLSIQGVTSVSGIDVLSGGALGGNGLILGDVTVYAGGVLAPGASPGALTVTGDVTMASGANFIAEIDGYGTGTGAGNFDRVVLLGADSVFTAGGTITPVLREIGGDANNDFMPKVGDKFVVVSAAGGVGGAFASLVQPSEGLPENGRFEIAYGSNTISLVIAPELYDALITGYSSLNGRRAARAMDSIRDAMGAGPTAEATSLFQSLLGLNATSAAGAFTQIGGEIHADALAIASRGSLAVRDDALFASPGSPGSALGDHCSVADDESRAVKTASGDCPDDVRGQAWMSVSGSRQMTYSDAYAASYQDERYAIDAGLNVYHGGGARIDLIGGYTRGDIATNFVGRGYVETYTGIVRGLMSKGGFVAQAAVGGTMARIETSRTVHVGGNIASNDSDRGAYLAHIDASLSYPVTINPGLIVSPFASAHAEYINADGYTEKGPDEFALEIEKTDLTTGRTRLGAYGAQSFTAFGKPMRIAASGAWRREIDGASLAREVNLHGAGWETRSASIGDNIAEVKVGWSAEVSKGVAVTAEYRGEVSRAMRNNNALIGLSVVW